jgi:hypothetical protein
VAKTISSPQTHGRPPSFTHTRSSSVHLRSAELTMAETEYNDPERIELLTALKEALNCNVPSIPWACLWLSDIDRLKKLVDDARRDSDLVMGYLWNVEKQQKIVQKCKFTTSLNIDSLILYRDSTTSRIIYSAAITFTIINSTANISVNFTTTTGCSTECVESSWS